LDFPLCAEETVDDAESDEVLVVAAVLLGGKYEADSDVGLDGALVVAEGGK
jgi:hypothetical protein